jgi:hypothetical protein
VTQTFQVLGCGQAIDTTSRIAHETNRAERRCPFHASHSDETGNGRIREKCLLAQREIYADDPERPEWCPLAFASVLVQLGQKP